jgi:phage baseplate assembly protein W
MAEVKSFDFKSVGIQTTTPKQPNPLENRPIGIRTPMRLGQGSDGIFAMHFDIGKQIRDNLRNLILTNHGERVGLYNFGANLRELTLELGSEEFDNRLLTRIKTAVARYMPYVSLDRMERTIDNFDNEVVAKVVLRIFYSVPTFRISNQGLEARFFIGG